MKFRYLFSQKYSFKPKFNDLSDHVSGHLWIRGSKNRMIQHLPDWTTISTMNNPQKRGAEIWIWWITESNYWILKFLNNFWGVSNVWKYLKMFKIYSKWIANFKCLKISERISRILINRRFEFPEAPFSSTFEDSKSGKFAASREKTGDIEKQLYLRLSQAIFESFFRKLAKNAKARK